MTTTARRVLAPVRITESYLNPVTGRIEAWAAVTPDGLWNLHRLPVDGTPWEAELAATGETEWCASLPEAQEGIADGSVLAVIEARRPGADPVAATAARITPLGRKD